MRPSLDEQLAPEDIVCCAEMLEFIADWLADQPRLTQEAMDAFCGGSYYDVFELRGTLLSFASRLMEERP
jgi:hypothetical protein